MRCSNCGLPLSPARTHCPRCGTMHNASSKKVSGSDALPPPAGTMSAGSSVQQPDNFTAGAGSSPQWNAYSAPTFYEAPAHYTAANDQQSSHTKSTEQAIPLQIDYWQPAPASQAMALSSGWMQPSSVLAKRKALADDQRRQRTMRIGFTAASLCLLVGALILTCVAILAQPLLPATMKSSQATVTDTHTSDAATTEPLSRVTPTSHDNLPGAQYITNARMANAINRSTGQAMQYATNFTPNQRIYVTFTLNTGNQGGAICFIWYLNSQYISQYAFSVGRNQLYNSYSYNSMAKPGSGSVEIYWASTVACTDKLLAEHVTFTVS